MSRKARATFSIKTIYLMLAHHRNPAMAFLGPVEGYPRLGSLMGADPPLAIFRRYSALNAQTLLYMQAEINQLEQELQEISSEDFKSKDQEISAFSREWWKLAGATGGNSLQWSKCLHIRAKLDQYCFCSESTANMRVTNVY